ncbi:alpha-glucan family phosphorylase [Rhodocytophaga rosea]|uniref:Alpha-glucan family phosphorylase n=1 Tax=Rhodocytophaga rosea TaxID=2704465 RepID=A0A6C0GVC8_9BACT|nr:alpha-glucan family phosphorylase [Rhodocytophaga rosea]QHT71300.1 alpha-glucan family phosphorylase [Rhodocytophaga rosea]
MESFQWKHPYQFDPAFSKRVAYFSMEFAIHQPLKTYAGGLGFLAGSHMRSAYALRQNMVGISILWKYGYYDQIRKGDQTMNVLFQEKVYGFLQKTNIRFTIQVNHSQVQVTAYYLPPEVFGTAPIFFLSTDLPENDYLAQTISHMLYDANMEAKIAAGILLGVGGARLLEILGYEPDIYHLNEAHALPLAFYLYHRFKKLEEVKKRLVFTTHTPEEAGNQKTDIFLLERMSYFYHLPLAEVKQLTGHSGDIFNHTQAALHVAKICNGVSDMHGEVSRQMWKFTKGICPIIHITNAQNAAYWADKGLYEALENDDDEALVRRKKELKKILFEEVADQTGEIYDENICTIVWARRFAGYKRADLLLQDFDRFHAFITNQDMPVQLIWAGKPYPMDYPAISTFDRIVHITKKYSNCAILSGYEMKLSRMLKQGADIWLNTPRLTHEASGTSGMTAAMNGAINMSTQDGWIPEFAKHLHNSFVLPAADTRLPVHEQDAIDNKNLMQRLEQEIVPMYYRQGKQWLEIQKNSMREILPSFDSDRMAKEYYEKVYTYEASSVF